MIASALAITVMVHPEISRFITGMFPPQTDIRAAVRAYSKFWLDVLVPPTPGTVRTGVDTTPLLSTD
jgi:hypothetical protein